MGARQTETGMVAAYLWFVARDLCVTAWRQLSWIYVAMWDPETSARVSESLNVLASV